MGLDLRAMTPGEKHAQWSYGGFARFRNRLAAAIGVDLNQMEGYGGSRPWSEVHDDLVPLLNHSDCDGTLSYEDALLVAPRLLRIVAEWPDDDYDRSMALQFVDVLNEAVEHYGSVRFS